MNAQRRQPDPRIEAQSAAVLQDGWDCIDFAKRYHNLHIRELAEMLETILIEEVGRDMPANAPPRGLGR